MATAHGGALDSPDDGIPAASGGPVIDVVGHLRELRSAVLPALIVGLVVGVLVGIIRYNMPETYERAATARIGIPSAQASETFAKAGAAQFESLGRDSDVLAAVADEVQMSSVDVETAVSVRADIAPGIVDVSARASSPDLAEALVRSTIRQLDHFSVSRNGRDAASAVGVAADLSALEAKIRSSTNRDSEANSQLAAQRDALASQLQASLGQVPLTLTLLSLQYSDGDPVAPRPFREGAVAALIAFLLALEGIVLFHNRSGRTVTPTWARRTGRALGIEVDSAPVEPGRLPVSTEIHVKRLLDRGAVVTVLDAATAVDGSTAQDPLAAEVESPDVSGQESGSPISAEPADGGATAKDGAVKEGAVKDGAAKDGAGSSEVTGSDSDDTADPDDTAGPTTDGEGVGAPTDRVDTESASNEVDAPEVASADPRPVTLPGVRTFGLAERWWDRADLSEITLALLVVDDTRTPKSDVLDSLDALGIAGIPTRLVVRETPQVSGPPAWLKI